MTLYTIWANEPYGRFVTTVWALSAEAAILLVCGSYPEEAGLYFATEA